MNESTLVPREEMSDLDWLVRMTGGVIEPWCEFIARSGLDSWACTRVFDLERRWFTREQYLARRAELQNKPSWKGAPEWAEWLAQDAHGDWWWHRETPKTKISEFDSIGAKESNTGEVLGDWRDTLEKRPADMSEQAVTSRLKEATDNVLAAVPELMTEKYKFEPFVSLEDAETAKQQSITPSKYTKTIRGVSVDVYDVLQAWGVSNPALQHLIKKALQCGQRGHKDNTQDLQDIIDSAIRAKELES